MKFAKKKKISETKLANGEDTLHMNYVFATYLVRLLSVGNKSKNRYQ
jgi:hypothetical protein